MLSKSIFKHKICTKMLPLIRTFTAVEKGEDIWSWIPPREKSDHLKDGAIPTLKG